ncbi:hypothetical protein NHX12_009174 [Muraenolepis orangiensis]|uniref:Uncharacterized protein n=1 Tax=Muraenolepis orangiensis TaxID=630683 RepID=A0A9Q0DPJ0_9TELE|nr:hypothetical protein NHX12_009174 [Muraenolepis orangiensis]
MARAETLESAGAGGGGGGGSEGERGVPGPLVQPSTCRMELPRTGFHTWSSLLTAPTITTSSYSLHLDQNHPLQNLPLPLTHPLGQLLPEGPVLPRPPLPPCARREEEATVCSGERPVEERMVGILRLPWYMSGSQRILEFEVDVAGSDGEEPPEASRGPGPLPVMRSQNERPTGHMSGGGHTSWAPTRQGRGLPWEVAVEGEDIRRVAHQLRAIGDQINTTVLRHHSAWRDWRSACLQLLNFVAQTLNSLYRLT